MSRLTKEEVKVFYNPAKCDYDGDRRYVDIATGMSSEVSCRLGFIEDLMEKYNVELGELDYALWHYAKCVRNFNNEYDEKLFKRLKKER